MGRAGLMERAGSLRPRGGIGRVGLQPACLQGLCSMTTQVRIVDLVELGKRVTNPLSLLGAVLISDC